MKIDAQTLGNSNFQAFFSTKYSYYAGSMYKGISSKEMVIALSKSGLLGFLGTGGMGLKEIEEDLKTISTELDEYSPYGANILQSHNDAELEDKLVSLFLKYNVRTVEASSYMSLSPALVRFCCTGLKSGLDGGVFRTNRIIAKVSRPEVAHIFMSPPPKEVLSRLVELNQISIEEAELAAQIPIASAICIESDSAGHTDSGISFAQFPTIKALRDAITAEKQYLQPILIGMAGGIGTPDAVSAAFIMGADFVATGSINQCSVEAAISDDVKNILQSIDINDTAYAPSGELFEMGSKVQVVKKSSLFSIRANKLYQLYQQYSSLEDIDPSTIKELETKYFLRTIDQVWCETRDHYLKIAPSVIERAEKRPKSKMALIFKWYFIHTTRAALKGSDEYNGDLQIHCGPALGAFNQIVKGGPIAQWQNRRVVDIASFLMNEASDNLNQFWAKHQYLEST